MQQQISTNQLSTVLVDNYQRRFQYLRLSLTDLCNFRCQYCLPNGYQKKYQSKFLTLDEIRHLMDAFCELGVKKVRLTGGEPTLRRDFTDIIRLIASYPQVKQIAVTTNGLRLKSSINEWKNAGLTSINVSIDSFSPTIFYRITGEDKLTQIVEGIDKAIEIGLPSIKINAVLMKGINDDLNQFFPWIKQRNVDLRFIELMETGEGRSHFERYHLSGSLLEKQLIQQNWSQIKKDPLSGPAKIYRHDEYQGRIGLIMPYEKNFCQNCNRLRISSTGKLHYCLFGDSAIDLRDLIKSENQKSTLKQRILDSLHIKPETHFLHHHNPGMTKNLSFIGG